MARMSAVLLLVAAMAVSSVHSQYLGFPYATTAHSFSLPFIGGFQYAPAIAPVGPVVKAATPFAAPGFPYYGYGAPFAHPVGPVVKAGFPFPYAAPFLKATVVKTAVPAIAAPVVKALPFAPALPAAFPAPAFAPAGPVGPAPVVPGPVPAPAPLI